MSVRRFSRKHKFCLQCGRSIEQVRHISRWGLCADCAEQNIGESVRQLHEHRGAYFEKWIIGMQRAAERARASAVGTEVMDDAP